MKRMKKSTSVRLVLLGSASLALAACDEAPKIDATFFADAAECAAVHGEAACQTAFAESEAAYLAEAPRYARQEDCEAEFGAENCQPRETAGGSFFLPLMMGYMMGQAFRQPVYRGPDGNAVARSGGSFYNVGKFAGAGRAAAFQPTQVTQVQRGGFGATASNYRSSAGS